MTDTEREQFLPVGNHAEPRHGPPNHAGGVLIPNELFAGEEQANPDEAADSDSRIHAARLEACRRSLEFQMEQYLHYVVRVRGTGMEPKNLLVGLGKYQTHSHLVESSSQLMAGVLRLAPEV